MPRQIALLRGINLASQRRVSMPALQELLTGLGYEDVRTHLQSGNVVLTSPARGAALQRKLEQELAGGLGFTVDVIVRSKAELARVVERNPLAGVADNPSRYLVSFLAGKLPDRVARELEEADLEPERVVVAGREIYAWHANGIQRSPLAKLLTEQRLGVSATARNWNTVTKLLELAGG